MRERGENKSRGRIGVLCICPEPQLDATTGTWSIGGRLEHGQIRRRDAALSQAVMLGDDGRGIAAQHSQFFSHDKFALIFYSESCCMSLLLSFAFFSSQHNISNTQSYPRRPQAWSLPHPLPAAGWSPVVSASCQAHHSPNGRPFAASCPPNMPVCYQPAASCPPNTPQHTSWQGPQKNPYREQTPPLRAPANQGFSSSALAPRPSPPTIQPAASRECLSKFSLVSRRR